MSDFTFPFHFHALEEEMATCSSVLAWRIPGTGEPGGLPSLGSHRVRHNWSDLAAVYVKTTSFHLGTLQWLKCCQFIIMASLLNCSRGTRKKDPILLKGYLILYFIWKLESYIGSGTLAAAAKSLQSCPTLCDPIDGSPPGSAVPEFSRQEHWSGLPFPSPMHGSEKWKGSHSVVSDS